MTEVKDNSSLPLLLSITGAILVVAVGGWFFLDQGGSTPAVTDVSPQAAVPTVSEQIVEPEDPTVDTLADDPAAPEDADLVANEETDEVIADDAAVVVQEAPTTLADAELSKARLAAGADMLVLPAEQSAIYYYGRVLQVEPDHDIAIAELDAVLTRVSQTVTAHLAAEEFDAAYEIAVLVAKQDPKHPIVSETQQTLDSRTEDLVNQALAAARAGQHNEAGDFLTNAEALPGRNPQYLREARDSITEIREVQDEARRDRSRRAQLAQDEARDAWISNIRSAIAAGHLISPAGASARDLLAEENSWDADRQELSGELLTAMIEMTQENIDAELPAEAEELLTALVDMGAFADTVASLRTAIEQTYVAVESRRIASMSELVQTKSAAPRYPRAAERRSLTGWVNVLFTVAPDGSTTDIEVYAAQPTELFDDAAVDAVAKWTFEPVEYRDQIISQRAGARLVFRVE